jgi:hypothetical protein
VPPVTSEGERRHATGAMTGGIPRGDRKSIITVGRRHVRMIT